ncbi:MAG: diacylglycerol kinase [Candidatus Doudnabacteria bacterium CG10_big_fil_rev_8_21_14_0_10_42_18]|uniref:Dihydrofolate reductase n=1 Tax=Candidatus Doudnabacteria bacterium CG10_big_fil_rev_8_21_14_0_10_42_18 TaxID=1974552 RepID=A0A2H0VAM4_9BACT|nr:MAG: diacylglycerol kinase [Candidatus Doudnabacteria bacterium CG10_big_fil_rev_8_21_14_0_10_42_18]
MKISLIAAHGKNLEIGKGNKLLWQLPEDMARFKQITTGHVVIMGSHTFKSIGRPLPNRTNIVLTHNKSYKTEGALTAYSINEALKLGEELEKNEIFIIGGGQIYREFLPSADKLYITLVDREYPDADTFFPRYDDVFKNVAFKEEHEYNGLKYTFINLKK